MSGNKNKVLDNEKYNKMGVTPNELYLRQTGKCWLMYIYDDYGDGKEVLGALYCTDGKEFADTSRMLNPTFECAQCFSRFTLKEKNDQKNK